MRNEIAGNSMLPHFLWRRLIININDTHRRNDIELELSPACMVSIAVRQLPVYNHNQTKRMADIHILCARIYILHAFDALGFASSSIFQRRNPDEVAKLKEQRIYMLSMGRERKDGNNKQC